MNDETLARLLRRVASGEVAPEEAQRKLGLPWETLARPGEAAFARLDHERERRRGFPEVVLAEGKSPEETARIVEALARSASQTLVTRAGPETARAVLDRTPGAVWHPRARALVISERPPQPLGARIGVISGGTSDIPVAEEAALTAELMGATVERRYDIGVAGIGRLLAATPGFRRLHALVAVAGMEAALAPVVAGLVPCPVIAVPTSVGYGASYGGLAALLALLNSCAPGVTVVNIDNGFGAGYAAALAVAHHRRLGAGAPLAGEPSEADQNERHREVLGQPETERKDPRLARGRGPERAVAEDGGQ